jgi:hypothetical protein
MQLCALALIAVLAASTNASAGARLAFVGDACTQDALRARVVELTERDPFVAEEPSGATVVVRVWAAERGVTADVWRVDATGHASGRRALAAESCDALASALAVVVAMALDAPDAAPPVVAPSREPEVEVDEEAPSPERATSLDVIAGAGASSARDPVGVAGARLRRRDRSLGIELELVAPDTFHAGSGQVRIARDDVALVPCWHVGPGALCGLAIISGQRSRVQMDPCSRPASARLRLAAGARGRSISAPVRSGPMAVARSR